MALVITDAADADNSKLPAIVIVDFSDGDIKAGLNTTDDRLQDLALSLEVHIFRDTQADPGDADIHWIKFTIGQEECQTGERGWYFSIVLPVYLIVRHNYLMIIWNRDYTTRIVIRRGGPHAQDIFNRCNQP